MKNIKAIIFDMDGVIVDSEYTFLESKTQILNEDGINIDISYQYQFMGTSFNEMWSIMKEELNLPHPVSSYIERMNQIRKKMIERDGYQEIPGVLKTIKKLFDQGYLLGLASSSPTSTILEVLDIFNIRKFFSAIVSGEECRNSKPNPEIFLKTAKLLDVPPDNCLVIEDSINGTIAAKEAGMLCFVFQNPEYYVPKNNKGDFFFQDFQKLEEKFHERKENNNGMDARYN